MTFGPITSLSITDSGFGYILTPQVTISLPDLDSARATATATINGAGNLSAISVVDSGAFYVNVPTVTISAPPGGVVTSASVSATGVAHTNGQIYNTTGGSGTGFRIRATSSGGLTSFTIIDGGKNYVAGDQVQTDNSPYEATIDIDSVGSNTTATATAVLDSDAGGRVSAINLVVVGTGYDSAPTVTIDSADGVANNFRATASATLDSGRISGLTITDSGAGYSVAPTVTIGDAPAFDIQHGDSAHQTLSNGIIMRGEVLKYSDSDNIIHIGHVGASDGKYHDFQVGTNITFGGLDRTQTREVLFVGDSDLKLSENEQNRDFSSISDDFLDFTEDNPFGEVENN